MLRRAGMRVLTFVIALGAGLAMLSSAFAEAVRLPKDGAPAFAFEAPEGWEILYDDYGNLRLTAEDLSCALQLSMIDDPALRTASLSDLAAEIMKAAGAPPYGAHESSTIAGLDGTAYISRITNDSGVDIVLRVTLVKLDPTHVAGQGEMRAVGMTDSQTAAMDHLLAEVRLVGLKAPQP